MKKFLFFLILMVGLIIAGCSDDTKDQSGNNDSSNQQAETEQTSNEKSEKEVYEVGDTAQLHSGTYGFPFVATVNSYKLKTNSNGVPTSVINVTIKNTNKDAFIPKNKISAQVLVKDGDHTLSLNAKRDKFNALSKKLKPGEEITGNLVYSSSYIKEADKLFLAYEYMSTEETRWKLPLEK
ncbi:hypothetical protein GCM10009001_20080 [Virgibacillus siamensis]|uniref:DUF4352 domain-containing protein n=2 Tax=Virgibacillus siamensis TaxID=480071 RepID=A0ABP3RAL0_9BACI